MIEKILRRSTPQVNFLGEGTGVGWKNNVSENLIGIPNVFNKKIWHFCTKNIFIWFEIKLFVWNFLNVVLFKCRHYYCSHPTKKNAFKRTFETWKPTECHHFECWKFLEFLLFHHKCIRQMQMRSKMSYFMAFSIRV